MITAMTFLHFLLFFNSLLHFSLSVGGSDSMESVPDLQKLMYSVVDGYPCVRLLNISGDIGCANPGREKVVAPIVTFSNLTRLDRVSAVLVSVDEIDVLFDRVSKDVNFASNIGGVLVDSATVSKNMITGFSPAQKFPQADFAPYQNKSYQWNPLGSGILTNAYHFPVFLLSKNSSLTLQKLAAKNDKDKKDYTAHVVEFDLVMQTTKSGTHDSRSCLEEHTCLPLGGYSVWSSLPPINFSSSEQSKPIILVVASMDAASFFRDKSLGAESPISGLISLLSAVDALSHFEGLHNSTRQVVFLVVTGEAWGYLGSRRFLHELDMKSDAVKGLNSTLIEMVLEIGSVGNSVNEGAKRFFLHSEGASSATNGTLEAFHSAQESLQSDKITVSSASSSIPGIPPSSLMAFVKKNPQISGAVLEDFDTAFNNRYYYSHLDDLSNINSSSVVAAATLVARAVVILANEGKNLSSSTLNSINVNTSFVEELMGCLLSCEPGLSCELVQKYISPTTTCPSHYVGVVLGKPSSPPSGYVDDISRFLWNFLADRTSISKDNIRSCLQNCTHEGELCIRAEVDEQGACVTSTTRYVPAYSTRLKFESGTWNVLPANSSDPLGEVDPIWTESNWDAIGLRVYTVQDASYDHFVLLGGIAITVLSYLVILTTRTFIVKALKQD